MTLFNYIQEKYYDYAVWVSGLTLCNDVVG